MSRRPFEAPSKIRFATYCLLSLGSVAIFQCNSSTDTNCAMQLYWLCSPCITAAIVYTINHLVKIHSTNYPNSYLQPIYTAPLSAVLVLLGHLAIWTQNHLTEIGTDVQPYAIHFAMSFYVLSECEFYRLYWTTHPHAQPTDFPSLIDMLFEADRDPAFHQSRDAFSYHFDHIPWSTYPPRDGWFSRRTLNRFIVDFLFLYMAFHMISMTFLCYPIKRLVNPDPEGDRLLPVSAMVKTLFTPANGFWAVVCVKLLRPVRLLNRMLFWLVVDCVGGVWERCGKVVLWWQGGSVVSRSNDVPTSSAES